MPEQLRRAAPRQPADWIAMYRLDNLVNEPWRVCRILDISPMGAGLQLFQVIPGELLDGNITISFELRGEGRGVVRADDGTFRHRIRGVERVREALPQTDKHRSLVGNRLPANFPLEHCYDNHPTRRRPLTSDPRPARNGCGRGARRHHLLEHPDLFAPEGDSSPEWLSRADAVVGPAGDRFLDRRASRARSPSRNSAAPRTPAFALEKSC